MKSTLVTSLALGLISATALAGARGPQPTQSTTGPFVVLDGLASTLTTEQRAALSGVNGETVADITRQVHAILGPAQDRQFDQALRLAGVDVQEIIPQDPGYYLPLGCFAVSKVGLVMSLVGYIGCPGDTAKNASIYAWSASTYSGACLLEQSQSCDSAESSAYYSASTWGSLLGSCSIADTAYYLEMMTYRTCGGPRDDGGDPTPTPTPAP